MSLYKLVDKTHDLMKNKKLTYIVYIIAIFVLSVSANSQNKPKLILDGFQFTEGPAVNDQGILFFSDVPARKIYKYSGSGKAEVFLDNTGGVNGLFFADNGELIACAGKEKREVMSIDPSGNTKTIVDEYNGKKLNSPNDLWVDPDGGIYFTDPRYGNRDNMEMEEHVYYIYPNRKKIIRVIDDMVRPNGIVGNWNTRKLYVVDQGVQKTYVYTIDNKGKLSDKKLFAECGIDGMSVGKQNDVFITAENGVRHYDASGKLIHTYPFQVPPTNVYFDKDQDELYVTTQAGEVHLITFD